MRVVWTSNPKVVKLWVKQDTWERFIKKSGMEEDELFYLMLTPCKGDGKNWFGVFYEEDEIKGVCIVEPKHDDLFVHALVGEDLEGILDALRKDDFANQFVRLIFASKRKGWKRYGMKEIGRLWEWGNVEVRT